MVWLGLRLGPGLGLGLKDRWLAEGDEYLAGPDPERHLYMSKARRVWPASVAQLADWPRLAEGWGSLRRDLTLRAASGEPAGRRLSHPAFGMAALPGAP